MPVAAVLGPQGRLVGKVRPRRLVGAATFVWIGQFAATRHRLVLAAAVGPFRLPWFVRLIRQVQ
jgi:hypothetical protein